jgi:His Kinase A (phospho-acceptor) domain
MPKESADPQPHLTPNRFWEFAALAHEIRQPLTAILSNAQAAWHFLAMDTPDLPEARAALADIIAGARRTNEVIRQLQAFLTAGTLEQTCLQINDVIHETIGLVRSDADAQHVRITLDLAAALPLLAGDRLQIIYHPQSGWFEDTPLKGGAEEGCPLKGVHEGTCLLEARERARNHS